MSGDLYAGWIDELDIPDALRRLSPSQSLPSHALITVVDSTAPVRDLPSLVPLLERLGRSFSVVGDDVAVDAPTLLELVEVEDFFNGFDEIWLFNRRPASGKPQGLPITSDVPLTTDGPPPQLSAWMTTVGAIAGLGDGDGLNYVTSSAQLAGLWRT